MKHREYHDREPYFDQIRDEISLAGTYLLSYLNGHGINISLEVQKILDKITRRICNSNIAPMLEDVDINKNNVLLLFRSLTEEIRPLVEILQKRLMNKAKIDAVCEYSSIHLDDCAIATIIAKTDLDIALQHFFSTVIQYFLPKVSITGEELTQNNDGIRASSISNYEVIIDPIDGTNNFISGGKLAGSFIALKKRSSQKADVAVATSLFRLETFWAIAGIGAHKAISQQQGKKIICRPCENGKVFINTKIADKHRMENPIKTTLKKRGFSVEKIPVTHEVARKILEGESEGYLVIAGKDYDWAAWHLILCEAGCFVDCVYDPQNEKNIITLTATNNIACRSKLLPIMKHEGIIVATGNW